MRARIVACCSISVPIVAIVAIGSIKNCLLDSTGAFEPWLQELWAKQGHPFDKDAIPELRVTKGLGTKGYNKVRISVIANRLLDAFDFNFTYRHQFRHRWTESFLHSKLVELSPGVNTLSVAGQKVVIDLPPEDSGIRGVFISDPCFSSKWIACTYKDIFQTFPRSVALLNGAFADPSMNLFSIVGDNFYDQSGELSKTFFRQLSQDVQRRFQIVVNGNHDNWVCGSPGCGDHNDHFGIGHMQYYPSDPVASILPGQDDSNFLDFSVDPDARGAWNSWMNKGSNFVVFHKLGNIGFLSFSGAASFADSKPHFQQACRYFGESRPALVLLLGHWNSDDMGCTGGMTTPDVRQELLELPECSFLGERLKYVDGHKHCNHIQAKNGTEPYGFMIGAHGMIAPCRPQFGFLFLDSTQGRVKLHYFEVASLFKGNRFDEILHCVEQHGLAGCTSFAETWLDIPTSRDSTGIEYVVS
eukprot:TRINITY_DN28511_c0_g1_i2.p1 TRINITY_DN28511_c0_g1~~TRINITY_DN28511_c0_g1_i2.p1  ORF type:complete len:493 (-),score=74.20 TRINITY_DN28511_c0_g1_i2:72-1484(-)